MLKELMEKDLVPLPDKVMAWVKVAQKEFYCTLCSNEKSIHTCACIGWDADTYLFRFLFMSSCSS